MLSSTCPHWILGCGSDLLEGFSAGMFAQRAQETAAQVCDTRRRQKAGHGQRLRHVVPILYHHPGLGKSVGELCRERLDAFHHGRQQPQSSSLQLRLLFLRSVPVPA